MSAFASLFSCCASDSSSKRFSHHSLDDGEPRTNVRVQRLGPSHMSYHSMPLCGAGRLRPVSTYSSAPPRYVDVVGAGVGRNGNGDGADVLVWDGDEKDRTLFDTVDVEVSMQEPRTAERGFDTSLMERTRSISDDSSVVSVPSTRLTGLTSTYTGATNRTGVTRDGRTGESLLGDNYRISGSHASCQWEGMDEDSPPGYYARSEPEMGVQGEGHPVMAEGWLERLRVDAERMVREERGT